MRKPSIRLYKLLFHISIITASSLIPFFITAPREFTAVLKPEELTYHVRIFPLMMTLLTPFYFFNVLYLIPAFLKKGNYKVYILLILLSGCVTGTMMYLGVGYFVAYYKLPIGFAYSSMIFPLVLFFAIGTSFEMIINSETQRREKEEIEKEKVKAELAYLKTQIDPHFLFNSLNSIYSLAEMNSAKTGHSILLLSDLMRYMLYESNAGKIDLDKEVKMLKNFISLQKIRISTKENVVINFDIKGKINNILVEPLLLLPFVENAFKYGISYTQKSEILIYLAVYEGALSFNVYNTKKIKGVKMVHEPHSGIGLSNVKRRLSLLYPENKHSLIINDSEEAFETKLDIIL